MAEPGSTNASSMEPRAVDFVTPQLTLRAVLTGMLLGGTLSICNVYVGLKIGWGLGMSITGILLAFAFWHAIARVSGGRVRPLTLLENNINQASCSAAAAVSSAGLVSAIPALTMLDGTQFTWFMLTSWIFVVCLVGITVASGLRRQMIVVDALAFPSGRACAELLKEIYSAGTEALKRVAMMGAAAVVGGTVQVLVILQMLKAQWFGLTIKGHTAQSLTWTLDPSLLMVGVGGLIGFRAGVSLLIGAILAWGVLGPWLADSGRAKLTATETLIALPAGLELPAAGELEYRESRYQLLHRGEMTDARHAELRALSADPAWTGAIDNLRAESQLTTRPELMNYTTARPLVSSVPLESWPRDVIIPGSYAGRLRYDAASGRLIARGPVPATVADELRKRVRDAKAAHAGDPARVAALDAKAAALEALITKASTATVPATIPAALSDVLAFDAGTGLLTLKGSPAKEQSDALRAMSSDPDWQLTAGLLLDGASFRKVTPNQTDLVEWLMWPGVTLMVVSALVSFSFSGPAMIRAFRRTGSKADPANSADTGDVSRGWFLGGMTIALILAVTLQVAFFDIAWWAAAIAVLLSFALAVVACRVSGETNVSPVGAMGKVTQLTFAGLAPKDAAANLMTASVSAGAATQSADLMHDFKCGHLIGAVPRQQVAGQILGSLAGAIVGSAFYLVLIPNPREMLLTEDWPAPAVAQWKAVAELFQTGFDALPAGTPQAMIVAAVLGVLLPVLDKLLPRKLAAWVPSASALGLAFVLPARNSLSMFLGALLGAIVGRFFPRWSERFFVTICAGIIAGESLVGAGDALRLVFLGLR